MNVVKKIFNILGILVSIVLSLILAAVLLVAPLLSAATDLVQTDTIHSMIRQVDFTQLLPDGTGDEMTDAILQTQFADDLVLLYVDDILAALDGTNQHNLTNQALAELVETHMDELIPIFRPYALKLVQQSTEVPDGTSVNWDELVTDEIISSTVMQYLSENGETLLLSLPTPEELGIDQNVSAALAEVRGGALCTAGIVLAAVLTILILLCRWVRFKGFMWTGVVYILFGAIDLAYSFGLKNFNFSTLFADVPELAGLIPILLQSLIPPLVKTSAVIAALGLLFVVIFVVARVFLKKAKTHRQNETVPDAQPCITDQSTLQQEPSALVQEEPPANVH